MSRPVGKVPMDPYTIFETKHWRVSYRRDSRYPGHLIVSSRQQQAELCDLDTPALLELGAVLKETEVLLRRVFQPFKVIFAKLGFASGYACHFHVAPVSAALLAEIAAHPAYADEPDGNDALLFLSRIYCERALDPQEQAAMAAGISLLREAARR